jgi:hypothetical protein
MPCPRCGASGPREKCWHDGPHERVNPSSHETPESARSLMAQLRRVIRSRIRAERKIQA